MRRTELLGLRVDQVGSLLRPASLIESFLSCAKGEITLTKNRADDELVY